MNPACRAMGLFLVLLALFQSVPVAVEAWEARQWPDAVSEWIRLSLLPAALWLYLRYFSILGCCQCGDDPSHSDQPPHG
jgi:ABC-type transport system involved in cytochrome c biogenesis permease subunit